MPQIFQVLRCYKCLIFQVHQTKKVNKWVCKLCGEKQSLKRHYGLGTGKECRLHVQKLNTVQADINEKNNFTESDEEFENEVEGTNENLNFVQLNKGSKWDDYVDKTEINIAEFVEEESDMFINNKKVVLEIPIKRKKCTDNHRSKKKSLNSCTTHTVNHSPNEEIKDFFLSPMTESDKILNQSENKLVTRKSSLKFVPPKANANSKWSQYKEESKCKGEGITDYSICNTLTINNIETNEYIEVHTSKTITPETTISDTDIYSKWAKFTDDINSSKDKFEYSLNNNSQNVTSNMKKRIATSLFDDCEFDVLDI